MKQTIKEAMKHINLLERHLEQHLHDEMLDSVITYLDTETVERGTYNFRATTEAIEDINLTILQIRKAINKANQQTLVGVEDYTIADALVRIAQLTRQSQRFQELASYKQKTRATTYTNGIEYTERLYDVKEAQENYYSCLETIHTLQTAIDRANILTEIEW